MSALLQIGCPELYKPCQTIKTFNTASLKGLANRLLELREKHQGAGIAAPQIGVSEQVICFGGYTSRYPQSSSSKAMILVNPKYWAVGQKMTEGWEACLSIPGVRGLVLRYQCIRYTGFDVYGAPVTGIAANFMARVIQHECDHLCGILFPQRIQKIKREENNKKQYGVRYL